MKTIATLFLLMLIKGFAAKAMALPANQWIGGGGFSCAATILKPMGSSEYLMAFGWISGFWFGSNAFMSALKMKTVGSSTDPEGVIAEIKNIVVKTQAANLLTLYQMSF